MLSPLSLRATSEVPKTGVTPPPAHRIMPKSADVVDPLHQSITLSYVILLFVTAILVIDIAVVLIPDDQRLQVARQTSAERIEIRSPHLINPVLQPQRH